MDRPLRNATCRSRRARCGRGGEPSPSPSSAAPAGGRASSSRSPPRGPELLSDGRDREFRHLVHALFGFAAHHERIRAGHAKVIGLAGIEYTVLISIAHLSLDGDVNVKTVADHLYLSGAFITSVTQRLRAARHDPQADRRGDRRRVDADRVGQGPRGARAARADPAAGQRRRVRLPRATRNSRCSPASSTA